MTLKRFYPGLGFASNACFFLAALCFVATGGFLGREGGSLVVLFALMVCLVVLGCSFWIVQTVLEVAFHLREQILESAPPASPPTLGPG